MIEYFRANWKGDPLLATKRVRRLSATMCKRAFRKIEMTDGSTTSQMFVHPSHSVAQIKAGGCRGISSPWRKRKEKK